MLPIPYSVDTCHSDMCVERMDMCVARMDMCVALMDMCVARTHCREGQVYAYKQRIGIV